jgi:SAM-dependent methyltransferase
MNYANAFEHRALSFLDAIKNHSECFENEFKTAVDMLDIQENEIVLHLGAAGLNIHFYFPKKNMTYIPIEFSEEFAKLSNVQLCSIDKIPLKNYSVDKILILALLHHFSSSERETLYKECSRILKTNGKLIIADVLIDSKEDYWLNNVVDRFNPCGHKGLFFEMSKDKPHIEKCGYDVECSKKTYDWTFDSEMHMVHVLKQLFFLHADEAEILSLCKSVLKYTKSHDGHDEHCRFEWNLLYFICSPSSS